jgi:beta-N-acetylhexosaminidase
VQCAEIMIEEHKKLNIKTALKHFPGHGSSTTDSHLGLVDVSKTWSVEELFPYKYLIDTGKVDMIMTAHIINKKLDDSGLPATLSKKIVTGLLRKQFHYDGIVISDDMQMHAISKYYGLAQSLKLSINAGVDIVIFSNNIEGSKDYTPENIHATFKKLVLDGEIPLSRINESFNRIMALKKSR